MPCRRRALLALALVLALSAAVRSGPAPQLPEGSGAEPAQQEGPADEQALESAASDMGDTASKDQLFQSLAELLGRLDQLPEPEPEQGPEQGLEQEPEQGPEPDQEPEQEADLEPEQEPEVQPELEPEQGLEQEPEQEPEPDQGPGQEPDQEPGLPLPTTVLPVRLTGVTVVMPDGQAEPSEPPTPGATPTEPTSGAPGENSAPLPFVADVRPTSDSSLEENEVPLPVPERRPVVEPVIVAESAPCLGCVKPIQHDSADLRRIANMAASLLEERLDTRFTFRVMEVYRASKQVVNGIKYFLSLELASTSCERPVPPFTLCYVEEDADKVLYNVEVLHQPHRANTELLSFRKLDRSEVAPFRGLFASATAEPPPEAEPAPPASSSIEPGDSLLDILMGLDSVIAQQQRLTPEPQPQPQPLPQPQPRWPGGGPEPLLLRSRLQAVNWPGEPAAPPAEPITSGCRSSRQHDNQEVPVNVAHPRVQKILHNFLESQERAGSNRLVITDIQSATRQIITETNYRFEFVLGVSNCPKNSTAHRYSCAATGAQPLSNCRVRARQRPGQPLQFNSISCTSRSQPECANGHCQDREIHPYGPAYLKYPPETAVKVDTQDSTYQQLVQHVQDEVNRRSRRPYLKKFVETLNATKVTYNLQETSDIIDQELYSLTLRFSDTACLRSADDGGAACLRRSEQQRGGSTFVCDVRVSSLGWADRMRVLDLFCESEPGPAAEPLEV